MTIPLTEAEREYVAAHVPSASQRAAIEAAAGPALVLAGPGAGKTFCLIERIGFLVERLGVEPARICAFTFTNKAAGEIASRLSHRLGGAAEQVKRGTLHAFCAELLREFGEHAGLEPGFGIADEDYQRAILRRLQVPPRWHGSVLGAFALHRFRGEAIGTRYQEYFERYLSYVRQRNVLDFDMLILETAALLGTERIAAEVRRRWDCVLVDEFQDLNPVQYGIVRALAGEHRLVFAVGDDEQSIYSWAGADPKVFRDFINQFAIATPLRLDDNFRCPRGAYSLARRLIDVNTPMFGDRRAPEARHESLFEVETLSFADENAEIAWVIEDLISDRAAHGLEWGDYALLYRTHAIGDAIEGAFVSAGIPCRLAQGRAFAEDPVVAYVLAALRVIANPEDDVHMEQYLSVVLPSRLCDDARAQAERQGITMLEKLDRLRWELPREHTDGKKIHRGFYALGNLAALGRRHVTLTALVEEILSQRVGEYRTVLEEHADELSDPAEVPEVVALAERLRLAIDERRPVWLPRRGGLEIPLKGILQRTGVPRIQLGGVRDARAVEILPEHAPVLGIALALFKAAQLLRSVSFTNAFRDFTAIDLETTDRDVAGAEIVEVAAVRVRDARMVDEFHSLVKPRVPIAPGAFRTHGISEQDVAASPFFEELWPQLRKFCGDDVLVAHNGYRFDFPILRRMVDALEPGTVLFTYDTLPLARELHATSRKLSDLARLYGIDPGQSHRALDDTRALALVFLGLGERKIRRARTTALVNLLDHLGVALALTDPESIGPRATNEMALLKRLATPFALGRYSDCLDFYALEREQAPGVDLPTVEELIERLGGAERMQRIRAERSASDRYPAAMLRMRRLLAQCSEGSLAQQIASFLEHAVLSKWDGTEPERQRVNLLTLHSTKGLEFSRVYVIGVEDGQLPGGSPRKPPAEREVEEARRLLYVGMTRVRDRLVLTRVETRASKPTGGHRFLDDMGIIPRSPTGAR
jgi:DNA helicase II / ATP-dependent DNA helicase PcrA